MNIIDLSEFRERKLSEKLKEKSRQSYSIVSIYDSKAGNIIVEQKDKNSGKWEIV